MKQLRIYLDTSVVNFLFAEDAPDFHRVTVQFFDHYAKRYFKHLANIHREMRIEQVNREHGYMHPLRLVSPMEVEDEN